MKPTTVVERELFKCVACKAPIKARITFELSVSKVMSDGDAQAVYGSPLDAAIDLNLRPEATGVVIMHKCENKVVQAVLTSRAVKDSPQA